ncbi:MAG TPA: hypothetical protein VHR72_02535, partial [Gemmataceae bacterium]|nr:hypothetical protein [Gemmataceae bacterium]
RADSIDFPGPARRSIALPRPQERANHVERSFAQQEPEQTAADRNHRGSRQDAFGEEPKAEGREGEGDGAKPQQRATAAAQEGLDQAIEARANPAIAVIEGGDAHVLAAIALQLIADAVAGDAKSMSAFPASESHSFRWRSGPGEKLEHFPIRFKKARKRDDEES